MASIFQVFDLNQGLSERKQLHDRRNIDGGLEAPRNSLDVPHEAADIRSSSVKPDDIPIGYELYNPCFAASGRRSVKDGPTRFSVPEGQSNSKRRAPNVVARLMGLDALPDDLPPVRPRKSLQEMPSYGCVKSSGGTPVLTRQLSQGATPSSWHRPPLPRNVQRPIANLGDERVPSNSIPNREHPQEKQLQEFKKEFEAKQLASLAKEQLRSGASELEGMNRQLEEKKNQVRATLDKAKIMLCERNVEEAKHPNAQEKFEESKEFLDAMEFLQCNKEFIFQFLQQKPHVVFSNQNSSSNTVVSHLKSSKKGKGCSSPRDLIERKREGFSPRAFARLFLDSRKKNDNKPQASTPLCSSERTSFVSSQPALERCNSVGSRRGAIEVGDMLHDVKLTSSSSTNSRAHMPSTSSKLQLRSSINLSDARDGSKEGAQEVIVEVKERLRQRVQNGGEREMTGYAKDISKEHLEGVPSNSKDIARQIAKNAREGSLLKCSQKKNITLTRSFSTGKRVSLQRVDMEDITCNSDDEGLSTPSVKIIRENVTRSCTSLPSSPHLGRSHAGAPMKVTRERAIEKTKIQVTNQSECTVTPRAADGPMAKKNDSTPENSQRRMQTSRTPVLPNNGAKRIVRRSESVNENAIPSTASKQKVDANSASTKSCADQANEKPNLTRCRSLPNVALLRERRQCTEGQSRKLENASGADPINELLGRKGTANFLPEIPKPGSNKPRRGQVPEKRKGFFSVGRKKSRDGGPEISSSQQLFSRPAPVLARVAALAESCVSQSNTLSDADITASNNYSKRADRIASEKAKQKPVETLSLDISMSDVVDKECCELSSLEDTVIPESSADSTAGPCEDDFLEVLSQLTPAKLRVESQNASRAPSSTAIRQQQAPYDKTRTEHQQAWTIARDNPDNVDDGHDSSSEKNGQPSPVSVLEAPFEEESPSPLEFKEITNDLQELRIRLRLLKVDGGERLREDLENVPERYLDVTEALILRDTQRTESPHHSIEAARDNHPTDFLQHKTSAERPMVPKCLLTQPRQERLRLQEHPCSVSHEADLAFVRDILVNSGFVIYGGYDISRWHSPTHPISPLVFEIVETSYINKQRRSNRQILFDAINEILAEKGDPQCCQQPWWQTPGRVSPVAMGKKLVQDVWIEIRKRQFPPYFHDSHNDYLESLVAQDLQTSSSWLALHHDVGRIGLHLELAIFNDLIEETVRGLLCVK